MSSPQLLAAVKSPDGGEGCDLTAYKDTMGNWTIGYGHKLQAGIDWEGQEWTQETADDTLAADLDEAAREAQRLPEALGIGPVRMDVLTELVFNMGYGKWLEFKKCRAAIQTGAWLTAKLELLNSKWAIEVGKLRSERLANQLYSGTYA